MDQKLRQILSRGKSLAAYGSHNWALSRSETLLAIDAIEREARVLLGGDVWVASNGVFSITGDSWHFSPTSEDRGQKTIGDSAAKARAYVKAYPEPKDAAVYFELVVE